MFLFKKSILFSLMAVVLIVLCCSCTPRNATVSIAECYSGGYEDFIASESDYVASTTNEPVSSPFETSSVTINQESIDHNIVIDPEKYKSDFSISNLMPFAKDCLQDFDSIKELRANSNNMEENILILLQKNVICFRTFVVMKTINKIDEKGYITSAYFESFDELKTFTQNTYVDDYATTLIEKYDFYEGTRGELCNGGGGPIWSSDIMDAKNYYLIKEKSSDKCVFICFFDTTPFFPDEPIPDYVQYTVIEFAAVIENGEWQLNELVWEGSTPLVTITINND